jgi:hypothetical protein
MTCQRAGNVRTWSVQLNANGRIASLSPRCPPSGAPAGQAQQARATGGPGVTPWGLFGFFLGDVSRSLSPLEEIRN